jgi:hypothetical protein
MIIYIDGSVSLVLFIDCILSEFEEPMMISKRKILVENNCIENIFTE